jgi:putative spermidine/putrescine transport system substrate-binding protein/spermidine/putrescine transport system substrate-binding protein
MKKALYLLVAIALLAGCAGPKKPNALNLLVFEGYADKSWLDPFVKETGAVVNVTNATSVDEIFNKMAADGGKGIDLATIDTSLFKRYYEHKLISPITTSKLKNYKDVLPEFQNLKVTQFEGKQYGVPYAWGTIPLFWDESVIKEKPDSWALMWDPRYKGKVLLLDEPQNAYVTMALKLGGFKDLWNFDDQDFSRLAEGFKSIAPQLRTLTTGATDAVNLIANHEAVIGMAFGEQLKSQALQKGLKVNLTIPKEGGIGWLDNWVISAGTQNEDLALKWIDWCIRKDNDKMMSDLIGYPGASNPAEGIDYASRCVWLQPRGDYQKLTEKWSEVKLQMSKK